MRRRLSFSITACLALAATPSSAVQVGVVASDARAAAAGVAAMADGGNAVDAAVTAALVLAVVYPEAGNLGGGGFALVRQSGEISALDFREVAPAAATHDMFLDAHGEPRPLASIDGPLAAAVPGSPGGYFELHRRFGRLPWAAIVEPARRYAADGFELSARTAQTLAETRDRLARFPESAAFWLPYGEPRGAGERIVLPALAATLAEYAARGPVALHSGRVADAVERASRRHGGVLRAADLAQALPVWRAPLRFQAFGWEFAGMPLPSSGGAVVGEVLALLERAGWAQAPRGSALRAHLLVEAFRRAFADRFLLGDPATTLSTPERMLDPEWIAKRLADFDRARATPSTRVDPGPLPREGSETTNLLVFDAEGGVVAMTTTLNALYGCALWVPEAGFFLNNEMDDFATAPGRPNLFGLVQGEASGVSPGRRPLSSMAPTLAWRGAELVAGGGRGGSRIPTGLIQALLHLWDGDAPAAAVARPRIHHQWLPDRLEFESGALTEAVASELRVRGHVLEETKTKSLPKIQLARRRADGTLELGADPRAAEAATTLDLERPLHEERR